MTFSDNGTLTLFEKDSTITISNTVFANGDRAIQSENSSLIISDSDFNNFTNNYGPLFVRDKWPLLVNITYSGNISSNVLNYHFNFGDIEILPNISLIIIIKN